MPIIQYNSILVRHKSLVGEKERICTVCGKHFTVMPGYVYKKAHRHKYVWYCSYTCYRKDGN